MKKTTLWIVALLAVATLAGCNNQNVWDVDYDLTTEIWREMHCYAQFQKDFPAKEYWAEWVNEVEHEWFYIVEAKVKADDQEKNLVCSYPMDAEKLKERTILTTNIEMKNAIGDPSAEFCNTNWWEFEIVSNETDIFGQCLLPNGMICKSWDFFNWECPSKDDENYSNYYWEYTKESLTNEDLDHIQETMPPISYEYEIWNMENETLVESGHYVYPNDLENGYVFIPEHATMANRVIKSSAIEDGMIYTLADVTLQDGTVISVLYMHEPDTLLCRAITVENWNKTTYYKNFFYRYDQ